MLDWNFEVVAGPFGFTEGPAWDGRRLYFSDIPSSRVLCFDPSTGEVSTRAENTGEGNGLVVDRLGRLFGCQGTGRRVVWYREDGSIGVVADQFEGKRLNSPNDLVVDSLGRIWFTDPRYGDFRDDMELDHESVFRCTPGSNGGWEIERVTFDTTRPNGLLLSPCETRLYVAQSEYGVGKARELRCYPVREDGSLGPFEVLHNFYPHRGIDGMCLAEDGTIVATAGWQESGPGPMLYRFSPTGRVLATHPVQFDRPTNCAWGGPDLTDLYVTIATGHLLRVSGAGGGCPAVPPLRNGA